MQQNCPYCGTSVEDSSDEIRPGVRLCPTCGQEVKMSGQPDSPPQGPGPVPSPQEAQGNDAAQATPPPPPPPSGAAFGGGGSSQSGSQTGAPAPSGPTEHTPAWEMDGGFWLQKLWRTIWQVLLHPVLTFSAPGRLTIGRPLLFAVTVAVACNLVGDLIGLLTITNELDSNSLAASVVIFTVLIGSPIGSAIGTVLGLFIFAGIFHVFLMIFWAAKGGFVTTFRVLCYAIAVEIFIVVISFSWQLKLWWLLVLGGLVFMVWQMIVSVAGLAASHGTSRWRIVGAIALMWAIFGLMVFGIIQLIGSDKIWDLTEIFNEQMRSGQL